MVWAALSIGVTILLAIWTVRPRPNEFALEAPRRWLVLPDERLPVHALALPSVIAVRPALPVPAVRYRAWSVPNQSWRPEKPLQPWFRRPTPYAVAAVFGAVSLDLTALGLGVPEIVPTHLPLHDQPPAHELGAVGFALDRLVEPGLTGLTATLFDTFHEGASGLDAFAWGQSDALTPPWQRPHEASQDWWA